jgi:hypothetical protein
VFSLGMTILELATDLDLPKAGGSWHHLRLGIVPADIKHKLSKDLLDIITLMINPDYTQRPAIDDILQLQIVDAIVQKRKSEIIKIKEISLVQIAYRYLMIFFSTIWYFLSYPIKNEKKSILNVRQTPKRIHEMIQSNEDNDDCEGRLRY